MWLVQNGISKKLNQVVSYPSSILARDDSSKKKTASIRLLLKIAKACLDLGNYQGALAIGYGLKMPACLMWHSAWEVYISLILKALPSRHLDVFKELLDIADYRDGYRNYWDTMKLIKLPSIPFLVPYFHDLLFIHDNSPTSINEGEKDLSLRQTNMEKFYDMFSIAAELETFRLTSYHGRVKGDKESCGLLLQHIRHVSKQDDNSIGSSMIFSSGFESEEKPLNPSRNKAIKKIVQFLSERNLTD